MARFSTQQKALNAGVLSPYLQARSDIEAYYGALKDSENWIGDQHGVLHRRPGTMLVNRVFGKRCLYEFDAGEDCPIQISAQGEEFTFFLDGEPIGEPLKVPYSSDEICDIKITNDCNAGFITHPNHEPVYLRKINDEFVLESFGNLPFGQVNQDKTCEICLGDGGSAEGGQTFIRTSRSLADGDTLIDGDGQEFVVESVLGGGVFTVTATPEIENAQDYNIIDLNGDALIDPDPDGDPLTDDGFDNSFFVSATKDSAMLRAEGCAPFLETMVGQQIRILDEEGVGGNEPNTFVTVTVSEFIDDQNLIVVYSGAELKCTSLYRLPAFADGVYPCAAWIHEDRLFLARDNIVYGSKIGDFFNWETEDDDGTVNPDNALLIRVNSGKCTSVRWLRTMNRHLIIATDGAIHAVTGSGVSGGLQADAFSQQVVQYLGAAAIEPLNVHEQILYVDRTCRVLRSVETGGGYDQISITDKTIYVDHIGDRGISKISFQETKYPTIWATVDDGSLYAVTYYPSQQVRGWFPQSLGGFSIKGGCYRSPEVCDVSVQRTSDKKEDVVLFAVRRTINGSDVYTHEKLGEFFDHDNRLEDAHFLDAAISLKNTTAVSGVPLAPQIGVAAAEGRVALRDSSAWYYGQSDGKVITYDVPNANVEDIEAGRSFVEIGGVLTKVPAPKVGTPIPFYKNDTCVLNPPCDPDQLAICQTDWDGFEDFEGECLVAYLDGLPFDVVVQGGEISVEGCVGIAGYPYVSWLEALPFRGNIGSSDGSNAPTSVIRVDVNIYRSKGIEVGSFVRNEGRGSTEHFRDLCDDDGLYTGWRDIDVLGITTNNDEGGYILRAQGPYPATIRAISTTREASGGR